MAAGTSPFGFTGAEAIRMANYGAAGAAGAPGFLSQIGSYLTQNPALSLGIGALGMSALGAGPVGTVPAAEIKLTGKGKELETKLYESIKTQMFPENLASKYLGQAKRMLEEGQRISRKMLTAGTVSGPDKVISGNVARAFLTETQEGLKGVQEGPRQAGQMRRQFSLNRLGKLQNFINLQLQTPVMRAESELISRELGQYRGAQRGAALGAIAQLLAAEYAYRNVR